jgi:hypothetical protein
MALGFAWQFSTVAANYHGNWTALFCTGSAFPTPPDLAAEHIYVFPNSTGYDGQFYHYVAHDPLYRTEIGRAIPDARLRYGRILVPALAFAAALGNQSWIDRCYLACNLLFLGFGAWCLARWLALDKVNPHVSILYVLAPASLIALDRLTVDLAFTSLCLAFLLYRRERSDWKLYVTLVLAGLCRDTGLVLAGAFAAEQWIAHRFRRGFWFASAAIPPVLWNIFVRGHISSGATEGIYKLFPFRGIASVLLEPLHYNLPEPARSLATALDYLELLGILLAIALAVRNVRRRGFGAIEIACLLWGFIALLLPRVFWEDCYSAARVLTPLLIFQALGWCSGHGIIALAPLAMVAPRIWLQLAPQVLGILHAAL